jgi:hypothetical protein
MPRRAEGTSAWYRPKMPMVCHLAINKDSQDFNHINLEMVPVHLVTQRDADLLVTLLGGLIEGSLRLCDLKFTSPTSIWISCQLLTPK